MKINDDDKEVLKEVVEKLVKAHVKLIKDYPGFEYQIEIVGDDGSSYVCSFREQKRKYDYLFDN